MALLLLTVRVLSWGDWLKEVGAIRPVQDALDVVVVVAAVASAVVVVVGVVVVVVVGVVATVVDPRRRSVLFLDGYSGRGWPRRCTCRRAERRK